MLGVPVPSAGMSNVRSLCRGAVDLRSESPIVRLLSLVRRDDRKKDEYKKGDLENTLGGWKGIL